MGVLQDTLSQSERDRATELSRLTAQLAEASARCEEMEREVRESREHCQSKAREEVRGEGVSVRDESEDAGYILGGGTDQSASRECSSCRADGGGESATAAAAGYCIT